MATERSVASFTRGDNAKQILRVFMITAHDIQDVQNNFKRIMLAFVKQDLINLHNERMLTLLTKPNVGIAWSLKNGNLLLVPSTEAKQLEEFVYITDGFINIAGAEPESVKGVTENLLCFDWDNWREDNTEKYQLLINDIASLPHIMID